MKEPKQVGQIQPEPAIHTAGIQAATFQGVVPLAQHQALTFEAYHGVLTLPWHGIGVKRKPRTISPI